MTNDERKTITDPDAQVSGPLGLGDQVIGLRVQDTNTQFILPDKMRITIGARDDCDITIENSSVSSLHCILERRERGILLTDQGSKNGTRRGQHLCNEFEVEDSVMFMLGTLAIVPFGARSAQTRRRLRRLVGYGESFQFQVERFLRATRTHEHVLLVGEQGCRRGELARLIHQVRDTKGEFVELTDALTSPGSQIALLKSAQDGSLFVHQSALPEDNSSLLHSLSSYRVRLIAATNDHLQAPTAWGLTYNKMQLLNVAPVRDRRGELTQIIEETLVELSMPDHAATISNRNREVLAHYGWANIEELIKAITCAIALNMHSSAGKAAKNLSIAKSTLSRRMKRYGLKK